MSEKYVIVRDSYNRMRAEITDSFAVGVKLLAEDHRRRVENQVHAYVVADLRTEVGPWRIRDIRIVWNEKKQKFLVRYKQWKTGKMRDGKEEYLDVAGPLDAETRAKVGEIILSVFFQIKEEAAKGTLGRRRDRGSRIVRVSGDGRSRLGHGISHDGAPGDRRPRRSDPGALVPAEQRWRRYIFLLWQSG